jgi:pyridoxamine 5'-phosphate oxidase
MSEEYKSLRKEYALASIQDEQLDADPFVQFGTWFLEAKNSGMSEPNAMLLATVSAEGQPSLRAVLLKAWSKSGFVFFTNYQSRKGREISENQNVALLFYWPMLERQVRIEGKAQKVAREVSERYFAERPRASQLSAAVSEQSKTVSSRQYLEAAVVDLENKLGSAQVPCPENWGGYQVVPVQFEFWQGRENRLHDRFEYCLNKHNGWEQSRLAP